MELQLLSEYLRDMTPHQMKLLEVIYLAGDQWISRAEIARHMGRRRLTPYDLECLNAFARRMLVEISTRPSPTPQIDYAWIYRMPGDVAAGLQQWVAIRAEEQLAEAYPRREPLNLVQWMYPQRQQG